MKVLGIVSVTERQKLKHSSCPRGALFLLKGEEGEYKTRQASRTSPELVPQGGEEVLLQPAGHGFLLLLQW